MSWPWRPSTSAQLWLGRPLKPVLPSPDLLFLLCHGLFFYTVVVICSTGSALVVSITTGSTMATWSSLVSFTDPKVHCLVYCSMIQAHYCSTVEDCPHAISQAPFCSMVPVCHDPGPLPLHSTAHHPSPLSSSNPPPYGLSSTALLSTPSTPWTLSLFCFLVFYLGVGSHPLKGRYVTSIYILFLFHVIDSCLCHVFYFETCLSHV